MASPTTDLRFSCPQCARVATVSASWAGQRGKCPGCRSEVDVPDASTAPPADVAPTRPLQAVGPRLPCRSCGEQVPAQARKCRHCGAFQQPGLRRRHRVEGNYRLAGSGRRLLAFGIDSFLAWAGPIALYSAGVYFDDAISRSGPSSTAGFFWGAAALLFLAISGLQWFLITTRGATVGKLALGLRIIRTDGSPVDFVSGVVLRNWILSALVAFSSCLYGLGALIWLVDKLFALAQDRRCLHDHLASTLLIETAFGVPRGMEMPVQHAERPPAPSAETPPTGPPPLPSATPPPLPTLTLEPLPPGEPPPGS